MESLKIVKFLVEEDADQDSKDYQKAENNAEKDTKDHEKETPLHLASLKGDFEIVWHLVENGANIQARTKEEKTHLDLAYEKTAHRGLRSYQKESFAKTIQFLKDKEAELWQECKNPF